MARHEQEGPSGPPSRRRIRKEQMICMDGKNGTLFQTVSRFRTLSNAQGADYRCQFQCITSGERSARTEGAAEDEGAGNAPTSGENAPFIACKLRENRFLQTPDSKSPMPS